MQGFQRKVTLERHQEICLDHKHCNTIMPKKIKIVLNLKTIILEKNFLFLFTVILKQTIFLLKQHNLIQMNLIQRKFLNKKLTVMGFMLNQIIQIFLNLNIFHILEMMQKKSLLKRY